MKLLTTVKKEFGQLSAKDKIKEQALTNLEHWLADDRLKDYRPYIEHLADCGNFAELLDAFWRMMPFGTGGRRGPVGAGPNRINPHTIALSVQGHCNYLRGIAGKGNQIKVVVAYDVRQFFDLNEIYKGVDGILKDLTSRDMARQSAMTYSANGVTVYVIGPLADEPNEPVCTDRFISTPELSFLIRRLNATGGLNISASHNHPDHNGGKFYNMHGGQEIPPNDENLLKVVENVRNVETIPYQRAREKGLINFVPIELHRRYIKLNTNLCPSKSRSCKIAFTPLSGTGTTTVKEALKALAYETVSVKEQSVYDGSFKEIPFNIPNPEVSQSADCATFGLLLSFPFYCSF